MTRYERVRAAIAHKNTGTVPSCIHPAGDGLQLYSQRLYDRYTDENLRVLCETGKISKHHAMYYGMGNHVLTVGCTW